MSPMKERIVDYWAERAESFQAQRMREFESRKKEAWRKEFHRILPFGRLGRKLRILDAGTGTGFFAFLLSEEGHTVTGIDLTPEMIKQARRMSECLGIHADFRVMDAEDTAFEDESFDAVVTRNLTWTLPHAANAYREWYRILKPGGILVNFDADYCAAEEEEKELPENHAHKLLSDRLLNENSLITMELSAYQEPRPQWDVQLLIEAGFERIQVDTGVYKRIYDEIDEFYNPVPVFMIAAYK